MTSFPAVLPAAGACLLALTALAACSSSDVQGPGDAPSPLAGADADVVFLSQSTDPSVVMAALFEGRVDRDESGCLRVDLPEGHTVIWPAGFTLAEAADGALRVLNSEGSEVGRVGGRFRLGGGEVAALHEGIPMTEGDRRAARERCPGRYWIVGGTY